MRILNSCCLTVLTFVLVNGSFHYPATKSNDEWWTNTIIYQVYPMSFKDSNGDGVGDLRGIIQKLDHFVDLGVETLWIGPLFKSPMEDLGYDVEDFKAIDPIFGTMDDFDELVVEMNKRNLKLMTDFIPNHSSDQCEWFKKSIKRDEKYSEYYVWRDAKNQKEVLMNSSITPIPPNNWLSIFGKSGWTWNEDRKQFYYHQFNAKQPDFNVRNPVVQQEFLDIFKFWMDKGVIGFRCDALKHLFESDLFLDEPYFPGKEGSINHDDMDHIYTLDQPESVDIVLKWRTFIDDYKKSNNLSLSKILATESYSPFNVLTQYYGNESNPGAQIPLYFQLVLMDRNNIVKNLEIIISKWLSIIPKNQVANWAIENHDNPRIPNRFGPETLPMFTALKLSLPGVDITYYGSEIGMEDVYVRPDQRKDPNNAGGLRIDESRDNERSPMQWDDSINAGFTDAKKSWLPVNPNYYKLNVEAQKKIPTSNYNFFKKMVLLRKTPTLKYGDLCTYNVSDSIYILKRSLSEHESYIVVMNFGSESEHVVLSNIIENLDDKLYVYLGSENTMYREGNTVLTNYPDKPLILPPQSVVVLSDAKKDIEKTNSATQIYSKLLITLSTCLFTWFLL